ncbi:MAG TPA: hypothetical protein VFF61_04710, partial [Microvirga sp.]|nr:hypothetical protein [Microvirga sp.]
MECAGATVKIADALANPHEHLGLAIVSPEISSTLFRRSRGRNLTMLLQTLLALGLAGRALLPDMADLSLPERALHVRYEPRSREVTNWRSEAIDALEPKTVIALAALFKAERPFVTRCVKLNNYWCIKSARWNGEIATDGEGHVGFASALHGA